MSSRINEPFRAMILVRNYSRLGLGQAQDLIIRYVPNVRYNIGIVHFDIAIILKLVVEFFKYSNSLKEYWRFSTLKYLNLIRFVLLYLIFRSFVHPNFHVTTSKQTSPIYNLYTPTFSLR